MKLQMRAQILRFIQYQIPTAELYIVGSSINGLGSFNCDMDMCLLIPDPTPFTPPVDESRDFAIQMLKLARNSLRRMPGLQGMQLILAKVPILRLWLKIPNGDEQQVKWAFMSTSSAFSYFGCKCAHLLSKYKNFLL